MNTDQFKNLKRGQFVRYKKEDKEFIGVFKAHRGSDFELPTRNGGTINPSEYGLFAFGRRTLTLNHSDVEPISEYENLESIKDEIIQAGAYFNKFHKKD